MGDDVIRVDLSGVHSNLVMVETVKTGLTAEALCQQLSQVRVLHILESAVTRSRMVVQFSSELYLRAFPLKVTELEEREIGERVQVIVKSVKFYKNILRIALHKSISDDDVELLIRKLRFAVEALRAAG